MVRKATKTAADGQDQCSDDGDGGEPERAFFDEAEHQAGQGEDGGDLPGPVEWAGSGRRGCHRDQQEQHHRADRQVDREY
jgi:hypothetical protein